MRQLSETPDRAMPDGANLYALGRHSFSDEAARAVAVSEDNAISVCNVDGGFREITKALDVDPDGYALVPVESSHGGLLVPHISWLEQGHVSIAMDVRHSINLCVGGVKGEKGAPVRSISSHEKGLAQARGFLDRYPDAKHHVYGTTVEAADKVKERNEAGHIVLASRSAISAMGLEVYEEDVGDGTEGTKQTQFYVVRKNGKEHEPNPKAKYHAAIITPKNEVGSLGRMLGMISNANVDLTSIHSRSIGMKEYSFFCEMERCGSPEQMDLLIRQLRADDKILSVKWLGSWDKRIETGRRSQPRSTDY